MRKALAALVIPLFLASCAGSPLKTGVTAEENKFEMASVREGMSDQKVIGLMGYPYKQESKVLDGETYDVWYYITTPTYLGQSRMIDENFTPFVFNQDRLLGWGWDYYKYLFEGKEKKKEETKYTNDENEWPLNKHVIIPPPKPGGKLAIDPDVKQEEFQTFDDKDLTKPQEVENVELEKALDELVQPERRSPQETPQKEAGDTDKMPDMSIQKPAEEELNKMQVSPEVEKVLPKEGDVQPVDKELPDQDQSEPLKLDTEKKIETQEGSDEGKLPECESGDSGVEKGYEVWD